MVQFYSARYSIRQSKWWISKISASIDISYVETKYDCFTLPIKFVSESIFTTRIQKLVQSTHYERLTDFRFNFSFQTNFISFLWFLLNFKHHPFKLYMYRMLPRLSCLTRTYISKIIAINCRTCNQLIVIANFAQSINWTQLIIKQFLPSYCLAQYEKNNYVDSATEFPKFFM